MAKPILEIIPYEGYNVVRVTNRNPGVGVRIFRASDYREEFVHVVDIQGDYFYDVELNKSSRLSPKYNAEFIDPDDRVSDVGWTFYDQYVPDANVSRILADGGKFLGGNGDYQDDIDSKEAYIIYTFHAAKVGKVYSAYTLILHTSYLDRVTTDSGTIYSASKGIPQAKRIVQKNDTPVAVYTFDTGKIGTIYSMVNDV
jgi:hypothetical protein